jgi:phosphate transport system substrate-binding protein
MKKAIFLLAVSSLLLISCSQKTSLSGAGATFPLPYYNLVFKAFTENAGIDVSYGGIGSGGGIRSLKDEVVDFAGSDAYLSDEEMAEMKATIHVPTCLGAVVLSYNLPDVSSLNLTGDIIAGIYLGKITRWNDAAIQAINPALNLPDKAITPVYRSDGSGTTFVFSDYMTKINKDWENTLGTGKSLNFAHGIAAKGNPGVAGTISQTEGAIGYIGSEYAFALNSPIAYMQNAAGEFILPSSLSISAAAQEGIADDTRSMITNSSAKGSYPISCLTWIIVYKDQAYANRSEDQARATLSLLNFILSPAAQAQTTMVHYAPLPKEVIYKAQKALSEITYNGKSL